MTPPHQEDTGSPTWQLVADLLTQRAAWDRAHAVIAPPPATCLQCAVQEAPCSSCQPQLPMPDVDPVDA